MDNNKNMSLTDTKMIVPKPVVFGVLSSRGGNKSGEVNGLTRSNVQIADVFMLYAQKMLMDGVNEKEIYAEAYESVSGIIEKYNLDKLDGISREKQRKNKRIIDSLVSQKARELVIKAFRGETRLSIGFDEFVDRLKIPSLKRSNGTTHLGKFHELLVESQTRAVLNCRFETYKDTPNGLEQEVEFVAYHLVPSWKVIIKGEDETGVHFDTFQDLINSKKKKKDTFIKRIEFSFNTDALAVFALPRIESGYSITDRNNRHGFNGYAFQLDWIVRSKYKLQHIRNGNYYPLPDLMKLFDTNYTEYKDFKARVLVPSIKEINLAGDIFVSFREETIGRKVIGIEFIVERNFGGNRDDDGAFLSFPLSYFISCRHFYSNANVSIDLVKNYSFDEYFDEIRDFSKYYYKNKDTKYYHDENDLTLQEWKELYDVELLAWHDLVDIYKNNLSVYRAMGWSLDNQKLGLVVTETKEYIAPFKKINGLPLELPSEQLQYLRMLIEANK